MNDFGARIRARRKEMKLTLRELADKADCSAAFLCDVELGKRRIGADLLLSLCNVLGLSMQETMAGTAEPYRPADTVPTLPPKLLSWAAGIDIPFRHVLCLYWLWRTLENYRTGKNRSGPDLFDWAKFYDRVKDFL